MTSDRAKIALITWWESQVILQDRTLILLHCPSTVNSCTASTWFHSIFTVKFVSLSNQKNVTLKYSESAVNRSGLYRNFRTCPMMRWGGCCLRHTGASVACYSPHVPFEHDVKPACTHALTSASTERYNGLGKSIPDSLRQGWTTVTGRQSRLLLTEVDNAVIRQ